MCEVLKEGKTRPHSLDQQHSKRLLRRCVETHRLDPLPLISPPFPSSPSSPSREDTLKFQLYLSFQINPSREVPHFSFSLFLSFLQFSSDPMLDMPLHANPFPRSCGASNILTFLVVSHCACFPSNADAHMTNGCLPRGAISCLRSCPPQFLFSPLKFIYQKTNKRKKSPPAPFYSF